MTPNVADDFSCISIPVPVITSGRFSRLEQLVIGAMVTEYIAADERQFRLSVKALARTVNCKWEHANAALKKAIEEGLLVRYPDGLYDLKVPKWMEDAPTCEV